MKKHTIFITMIGMLVFLACSKIEENTDPIIGIWSRYTTNTSNKGQTIHQEWIFNDAYLGRYHNFEGNMLTFQTDFKWKRNDNVYVISYPGTEMKDATVIIEESEGGTILLETEGEILAIRD